MLKLLFYIVIMILTHGIPVGLSMRSSSTIVEPVIQVGLCIRKSRIKDGKLEKPIRSIYKIEGNQCDL